MKKEWKEYYLYLEALRESGVTNMFGAVPYILAVYPELSEEEAKDILLNWMDNYKEIMDWLNSEKGR